MAIRKRVRGTFEKVVPISPEFYDDHKDEDLIAPKSVLLPFNAVLMLTQWIAFAALMVYYSGPAAEVTDVRVEAQWDYGAPDYNCTPLAKDSYWGQRFNFDTCVELSQPPSSGIDSSSSTEFYRYTQFPFLNASAPFHAESFGVGVYGDEQGARGAFEEFKNRLESLDLTCPYFAPEIPGGTLEIPKFTYKWVDYPGDFSAVPEYKGTRADVCTDYADDAMDGVKRRCKSDSCARPERTSDELQICAQARFEAYARSKIEGGGNEDKNCIHLPGADLTCTQGYGCVYFSPCVQQCVNLTLRSAYDNRCTWNDFTTADSDWGDDPFEQWDDLQSLIDARQCDSGRDSSVLDVLEPSSCYYHFDNETVDALFQLNPKLKDLPFDYRNIDIFEGNPLREAEYFNIIRNYNRGKVLRRCEVPESDALTILNVFNDEKITCQYAKENFPFTCVASFSPSIAQRGSMSYANSLLLYSVFSAICVKVFFASSSKGDKAAPDDIAKGAEVAVEEKEASATGKRTRSDRAKGLLEKIVPISPEFYDEDKDEDLIAPKSVLLPFNAVLMLTQWVAFAALMVYYSGPAAEVTDVRVEAQWNFSAPDYNCTPMYFDSYWGQEFNFDTCVELSQPPSSGIDSSSSTEFYRYTQFPFLNASAPFHEDTFGVGEYGDEQGALRALEEFKNRLEGLELTCPYFAPEIPGGTLEIPKSTYKWVDYDGDFSAVPFHYKLSRADVCTTFSPNDLHDAQRHWCFGYSCGRPDAATNTSQNCGQAAFENYADAITTGNMPDTKLCLHPSTYTGNEACGTGQNRNNHSDCTGIDATVRANLDVGCDWTDFYSSFYQTWDPLESLWKTCDSNSSTVAELFDEDSCYYKFDQVTVDLLVELNPRLAETPFSASFITTFTGEPSMKAAYFGTVESYARGKVLRRCEVPESDALTILNVFYDEKITCQYAKENYPFSCTKKGPPSIPQRASLAYANSLLLYSVFSAICVRVFFASSSKDDKDAEKRADGEVPA